MFKLETSEIKLGSIVGKVIAKDKDQGLNGDVHYHLRNPGNKVSITETNKLFGVDDISERFSLIQDH